MTISKHDNPRRDSLSGPLHDGTSISPPDSRLYSTVVGLSPCKGYMHHWKNGETSETRAFQTDQMALGLDISHLGEREGGDGRRGKEGGGVSMGF